MPSSTSHPTSSNNAPAATSSSSAKRGGGKAKKAASTDPVHTSKQIEDTIAMLEKNRAGDKEQELEIEREVKKATRDLNNLLQNLDPSLSRVDTLQRKYSELLADMKRVERDHLKSKKRADQLQKEKDQSRHDLTKLTTTKDKLEKLCREMQRENKKLKDENRALRETESRMRDDLHNRLDSMLTDVQEVIDQKEHPENIPAIMDTDDLFRHKFKSFIDQYEIRELQFHSLLRTKELEVQYQLARYEQQRKAQEHEASKSRQLTSQVSTFSQTETELRSQLNIYVEKFKQVEDTLNNSNDLFLTFRREMEEMSKKTKRLEKENAQLTRRHEATNQNILQMAEDRTRSTKEIDALRREKDKLEKLCRGMQAQGRAIQPPPPPPPPPPPLPQQQQQQQQASNQPLQQKQHHHHHHHHHHHPHPHPHTANNGICSDPAHVGSKWDPHRRPETDSEYEDDDEDEDISGEEDDDEEGEEVYSDEPAEGASLGASVVESTASPLHGRGTFNPPPAAAAVGASGKTAQQGAPSQKQKRKQPLPLNGVAVKH